MRKDTPVSTQLPEWKKEIAEKVKAYGERKKRLTTPPGPIKDNIEPERTQEASVPNPEQALRPTPVYIDPPPEAKEVLFQPLEAVTHSTFDVWTEDVIGVEERKQIEEATPSTGPYLLRRIAAGAIDHTIIVVLLIAVLFAFSVILGESMKWLVVSAWMATISLFLLLHFIYHLYFLRSSRQTPGMLFLSLELRDPGGQVIPVGKIIVRWFTFIILNVFNLLPAFMGKPFLLHDHVSSTEMRSFK